MTVCAALPAVKGMPQRLHYYALETGGYFWLELTVTALKVPPKPQDTSAVLVVMYTAMAVLKSAGMLPRANPCFMKERGDQLL